ncbi:ABC transporter ATP-binding protein [Lignipirellula cremea]|uniref:Putative ABC transporter ATP-binding protein YbbL n=1 Tax=Lignipirellula cremea TaxID=2528010 RepID=A0A518DL15_9BACT|nr:ATP-binding cassette domain-containing protein [Lignipirellula cremea]QDU92527.1 putative ABC transporter ATP-binding protein YbbL [Lignipirellula cremea]
MDDTNQPQQEASDAAPLLQALGLRRTGRGRVLLEDVSLSVRGGDRIALLGPSGSGKTLLLRALGMLDPLAAGEIHWRGQPVRGNEVPRFRSQVIYLHQRPALVEGAVEENLRQPYSLRAHADKRFQRDRIVAWLESLGRDASFLAKQQRDLSGGESQLAALLRAIQLDPILLLLDEPTATLDGLAAGQVETLVEAWLNDQPTTRATVWVTHDHEQARRVSTSVLHIREGKLS